MSDDLHLESYDSKTRKLTYNGDTSLEGGPCAKGISFKVYVTLPDPCLAEPKVSVKLELDAYRAVDFDTARYRMALWLKNIAEALEGTIASSVPVQLDRTAHTAVHIPEEGSIPTEGDQVIFEGDLYDIERHAARGQVKLSMDGHSLFVPTSELRRIADIWHVNPQWSP